MKNKTSPTTPTPQVIWLASMMGSMIEFFDFNIYTIASVLVFPALFFPKIGALNGTLASFATFSVAFLARPLGAVLFGHAGDRWGRKSTLIASLVIMGLSTILVGFLPGYDTIGIAAPAILVLLRFIQGIGLGGEWSGAMLLSTEYAPVKKRAWYGMFTQIGAPVGFMLSSAFFALLMFLMGQEKFIEYGWRIPFLISSIFLLIGLFMRLRITETPIFQQMVLKNSIARYPIAKIFSGYSKVLVLACTLGIPTFLLNYCVQVFGLSWATTQMGYGRQEFLTLQILGSFLSIGAIVITAKLADLKGRKWTSGLALCLTFIFALAMPYLLESNTLVGLSIFILGGIFIAGLIFSPMATQMVELFPAPVRYTGSALAYSISALLGGGLAPLAATWIASRYGLPMVGIGIAAVTLLSMVALYFCRETRHESWDHETAL